MPLIRDTHKVAANEMFWGEKNERKKSVNYKSSELNNAKKAEILKYFSTFRKTSLRQCYY